jgi:hypothetical protein
MFIDGIETKKQIKKELKKSIKIMMIKLDKKN